MANIHINYSTYGNKQDVLIENMVNSFREIVKRNLKGVNGKFLFEYIDQHNQFDIIEFPESDIKLFPMLVRINEELPNCFIAGLNYYKSI